MLNRRERFLVNLLPWFLLLVAGGIFVIFQQGERAALQGKAREMEAQITRLAARIGDAATLEKRRAELEARLDQRRAGLYAAGEMDVYRFGILIRNMLKADGLKITRYQSVDDAGRNLYEFAVGGSPLDFMQFLQQVSLSPKRWPVSRLATKAAGGSLEATFRIGYESLD